MSEQSGSAPADLRAIPITAFPQAGMRHVEIQVRARYTTQGGIQLGWRDIPSQIGIPVEIVAQQFVGLCRQGAIQKRVRIDGADQMDGDGKPHLELVHDHFELTPSPAAAPPPAEPPSRIILESGG